MNFPALLEDTAVALRQVRQTRQWLATLDDASQIADAEERARLGLEVLKITKEAETLAREVQSLQCEALRKLAQLDGATSPGRRPGPALAHLHSGALRHAARWLASMPDDEFAELIETCSPWSTVTTLHYNARTPEERKNSRARALRRVKNGHLRHPVASEPEDLTGAARQILTHLAERDGHVTTADAALKLGERLGLSEVDTVTYQGLAETVRQAVMLEWRDSKDVVALVGGRAVRCPKFVTYQEEGLGWVRVPWDRASLGQLEFMLAYRTRQIAELVDVRAELDLLVQEAVKRSDLQGTVRLSELFPPTAADST